MKTNFLEAQQLIYEPLGWKCNNVQKEIESQEYGACSFEMNENIILFRVSKITPTKIGQFVTFWKRIGNGPIMPYDMADSFNFLVVSVRDKNRFGQFVFPKAVLYEKGIISHNQKGGKCAIRVYPIWDIADNPQAKKTQAWQLQYFFKVDQELLSNSNIIRKMYGD